MENEPLLVRPPPGNFATRRKISIEPVHFLYWLYMSGSMPLVSQFVHHKIQLGYNISELVLPCTDSQNSTNSELADKIQSESSTWLLYLNVAAMIPGIVSTILLSAYSERRGRKVSYLNLFV